MYSCDTYDKRTSLWNVSSHWANFIEFGKNKRYIYTVLKLKNICIIIRREQRLKKSTHSADTSVERILPRSNLHTV